MFSSAFTREQRGASRPAAGRIIELGETQTASRESVEIGRGDFSAVASKIRIPEVVGQDDQDIRSRGWRCRPHMNAGEGETG